MVNIGDLLMDWTYINLSTIKVLYDIPVVTLNFTLTFTI